LSLLDRNTRIIDFILTQEGKKLRSEGKLNFKFFTLHDEEVDYHPYISNSGSLTAAEFTSSQIQQIEETNVREAVTGLRKHNGLGKDQTNLIRPLFTIPQGQNILPELVRVHRTGSVNLTAYQQKVEEQYEKRDDNGNILESIGPIVRGYQRFNSTLYTLDYRYTPNSFPSGYLFNGLRVNMYISGSEGYEEVDARYDLNDDLSFRNDLKLATTKNEMEKSMKRGDRKTNK
jgi:hypothetical protein